MQNYISYVQKIGVLTACCVVAACQPPGANLAANAYSASQVNSRQEAKVINIIAVSAAKVEASNEQQQKSAQVLGALVGAVGGGIAGNSLIKHSGYTGAAVGVAGGTAAGAAVGSLVPDKVLVDGVSIAYEDGDRTFNSVQVGELCQFQPGRAIMVASSPTETRIQPNHDCPVPQGGK